MAYAMTKKDKQGVESFSYLYNCISTEDIIGYSSSVMMDKSLWLVVVGLLHAAAHDLCVQHLLTAFRTAVSI
jgi:hypothetical protein